VFGMEGTDAWGKEARAIGTEARRAVECLLSAESQLRILRDIL